MSFPRRDNQITSGAVLAWLLVIVLTVVVLFLVFKPKGDQPTTGREGRDEEGSTGSGHDAGETSFADIADMEWLLTELTIGGEALALSDEVASTFRIDADGKFGGNGGCNNYFGQFSEAENGEGLTASPIGSTRMACPPPKGQQEGVYLGALEQVTRLSTQNHRLRLSSEDGSTVLLFALIIPDEMGEAEGASGASGSVGAGAGVGAAGGEGDASGGEGGASGSVGAGAGVGAAGGAGAGGDGGEGGASGSVGAGAGVGAAGGAGAGGDGGEGGDGTSGAAGDQGNIDIDAQSAPGGKAAAASIIYRGQLQLQGKHLIFTPCGADFTVRLEDARDNLDVITEKLKLHMQSGIFGEFRAALRAHDEDGARLRLTDPLFMANEGGSCEHPTQVGGLVASGNEPFWTLTVGETHTTLRTPKGEWRLVGGMHPNDAFFSMPRGSRYLSLSDPDQNIEIKARIDKNPCHDSMVDAWSTYTVEIEYNGTQGKGCGRPGRWLPPLMGRYRAELASASSPGRSIELMLGDGGLAILKHDYQNGEPAVQQQGLWQLRDRSTVKIQFMTQNGKPSHERLVFTGDGNTLTAVEFDPQHWGSEGLRVGRIVDEGK